MAKPIKITPTLKGSDAIKFLENIKHNRSKTISKATILAIREGANKLQSLSKGN